MAAQSSTTEKHAADAIGNQELLRVRAERLMTDGQNFAAKASTGLLPLPLILLAFLE